MQFVMTHSIMRSKNLQIPPDSSIILSNTGLPSADQRLKLGVTDV